MDFEKTISWLAEYLGSDKIKIINPERAKEFVEALKEIQVLFKSCDEETSIESEYAALDFGDACISVTTPTITVFDINTLVKAISKADNVDIYPTRDGRVKMDVLFNNVYYVEVI